MRLGTVYGFAIVGIISQGAHLNSLDRVWEMIQTLRYGF